VAGKGARFVFLERGLAAAGCADGLTPMSWSRGRRGRIFPFPPSRPQGAGLLVKGRGARRPNLAVRQEPGPSTRWLPASPRRWLSCFPCFEAHRWTFERGLRGPGGPGSGSGPTVVTGQGRRIGVSWIIGRDVNLWVRRAAAVRRLRGPKGGQGHTGSLRPEGLGDAAVWWDRRPNRAVFLALAAGCGPRVGLANLSQYIPGARGGRCN